MPAIPRPALVAALLLALAACAPEEEKPAPGARPPEAAPEQASPARRGATVARRSCAFCHQVAPDRPSAVEAAAPSFMEIANLPGRSREYLRDFATSEHMVETLGDPPVAMPTIGLSPEEREDVIAYILQFQRDPATGRMNPVELEPFE